MTHENILALQPGPELDQAVHVAVFGGIGKLAPYSTKDSAGLKVLDRLPLFIGRVDPSHPRFDASRPWVSGTLTHNAEIKGDMTALRVTAPTRGVALCKAALLVLLRPARAERPAPRQSSADAAREVAARIGTPAARNPNRPTIPQPTARPNARARQPLPKRVERFQAPEPQPPANRTNA